MSKLKCVQERTLSAGVQAWYMYCPVITAGNVYGELRLIEEKLERN